MGYSKSEIYGNAKLSDSDVRAVRRRRGEHPRLLAKEFKVAPETIRKVWRGDTYTMVDDEGPATGIRPPTEAEIDVLARESARKFQERMVAEGRMPAATMNAAPQASGMSFGSQEAARSSVEPRPSEATKPAGAAPLSMEEIMRREHTKGAEAAESAARTLAGADPGNTMLNKLTDGGSK